jgi:hypothetical protein
MATKRKQIVIDPKHHRALQAIRSECKKSRSAVVPSMQFLVFRALEMTLPQLQATFRPSED